ncbi:MAG: helix-turn-helix domain-containing protein [Candidatus Marinimicrobia bacterium]|nr:helix-turn-helix domain-containing protein [Candidatus Neomarinimicrobiota bacterium]
MVTLDKESKEAAGSSAWNGNKGYNGSITRSEPEVLLTQINRGFYSGKVTGDQLGQIHAVISGQAIEKRNTARLLTFGEAAERLRVSTKTLSRMRARGAIGQVAVYGNVYRIPESEVERLIQGVAL